MTWGEGVSDRGVVVFFNGDGRCDGEGGVIFNHYDASKEIAPLLQYHTALHFAHALGFGIISLVNRFEHPPQGCSHVISMLAIGRWEAPIGMEVHTKNNERAPFLLSPGTLLDASNWYLPHHFDHARRVSCSRGVTMSTACVGTVVRTLPRGVTVRSAVGTRVGSSNAHPMRLRDFRIRGLRDLRIRAAADSPPSPAPQQKRGRVSARWIFDTKYGHKADALRLLDTWIHTIGVEAGLDPNRVSLFTGQLGCPESRCEMHCEQFDSVSELDAFFNALPGAKHKTWGALFAVHVMDGSPTWHVLRAVALSGGDNKAGAGAISQETNVVGASGEKQNQNKKTLSFVDSAADAAAAVAAAAAFDVTYNSPGWIFPAVEENESSSRPPRVKSRAPKSLSREQMDMPVFSPDLFGDGEGLVFPSSSSDGDDDATDDMKNDDFSATFGIDLSQYEPGTKVVMDWKGDAMVISPRDKLPNIQ